MKKINNYISEVLKINSKSKVNNVTRLPKEIEDKILDELCKYFQASGSYGGREYKTRLGIVTTKFNKDIYKFFDQYDIWEDMAVWLGMKEKDADKLKSYIEENKEQLYKDIEDFVLDDILQ